MIRLNQEELLFCWSNWGIAALPLLHLAEKWWDVASRYHFEKKQYVHLSTWGISGNCFCSFQNFQHSLWVLFVAVSNPWPWRDPNLFESTCSEVAIGSYKHATLWCFEYWYWKVPTNLFAKKSLRRCVCVYMYKFIGIYIYIEIKQAYGTASAVENALNSFGVESSLVNWRSWRTRNRLTSPNRKQSLSRHFWSKRCDVNCKLRHIHGKQKHNFHEDWGWDSLRFSWDGISITFVAASSDIHWKNCSLLSCVYNQV